MKFDRLVIVQWLEWCERVLLVATAGVVAMETCAVVVLRVGRILAAWLLRGVPIHRAAVGRSLAWVAAEVWVALLLVGATAWMLAEVWRLLERMAAREALRREHV